MFINFCCTLIPFLLTALTTVYFRVFVARWKDRYEKNMKILPVNGYIHAHRITGVTDLLVVCIAIYTNRSPAIENKHMVIMLIARQYKNSL